MCFHSALRGGRAGRGWVQKAPAHLLSLFFICRSHTRLLGLWIPVLTCPARGGKSSSCGMKPITCLWDCTQAPPTPSPSKPAQSRALGHPSPPGLQPRFQVLLWRRRKKKNQKNLGLCALDSKLMHKIIKILNTY